MTPSRQVDEIAASLTKAQIGWLCGGEPYNRRGYWPLRHAMRSKGLLDENLVPTPLGLEVRALILDQGSKS